MLKPNCSCRFIGAYCKGHTLKGAPASDVVPKKCSTFPLGEEKKCPTHHQQRVFGTDRPKPCPCPFHFPPKPIRIAGVGPSLILHDTIAGQGIGDLGIFLGKVVGKSAVWTGAKVTALYAHVRSKGGSHVCQRGNEALR